MFLNKYVPIYLFEAVDKATEMCVHIRQTCSSNVLVTDALTVDFP